MLAQQIFNAVVAGSVYALFALGFTLTFGVLRVINLLYGFYFACGAFAALWGVAGLHLPLWAAAAFAVALTGLVGLVCDSLMLLPLRRARAPELATLIVTLGGVLLLDNLATLAFGAEARRFPPTMLGQSAVTLGPISVAAPQIAIIVTVAVVVVALVLFLERTRVGTAVRAIAENPDAARLMGINVTALVTFVSVLSAALAGTAGLLIGVQVNAVDPFMGEPMMLRGFAVIIIGGLGSIRGALIAGMALGFVEVMTAAYVSSDMKDAAAFAALVLVLWMRPAGLFGAPQTRRA